MPALVRRPSLESEASFIVHWLKVRHEAGRPWNEMAVLYRAKFVAEKVVAALLRIQGFSATTFPFFST
jgi:hypothetical protein